MPGKWILKFTPDMSVEIAKGQYDEALLAGYLFNIHATGENTKEEHLAKVNEGLEGYRHAAPARKIEWLEKVLSEQKNSLRLWQGFRRWILKQTPEEIEKLSPATQEKHKQNLQKIPGIERNIEQHEKQIHRINGYISVLKAGGELVPERPPRPAVPARPQPEPEVDELLGPYMVPAHSWFHDMVASFATADFDPPDENEKWPHKTLHKPGKHQAKLRMRPPEENLPVPEEHLNGADLKLWQDQIWDQVRALSDHTADVLECVFARYLEQADNPKASVWITAGDVLEMRGVRHHKKGGWKWEDKRDVAMEMHRLNCAWLRLEQAMRVEEVTLKNGQTKEVLKRGPVTNVLDTKLLNVTSKAGQKLLFGGEEFTAWRISMGEVVAPFLFGAGRKFALVSRKVLALNPLKQRVEKRLGRYLFDLWRWRSSPGDLIHQVKVRTLAAEVRLENLKKDPGRRRARLEQALDTLQQEGIIAGWQYEDGYRGTENHEKWLETNVVIEPPEFIKDQAAKIKRPDKLPAGRKAEAKTGQAWNPAALVAARRRRGLTQLQAVEELQDMVKQRGMRQKLGRTYYNLIESGKKQPKETLKKLLLEWAEK